MKEFVLASVSPRRAFELARDRKGGWIWPLVVLTLLTLLTMWLMEPGMKVPQEEIRQKMAEYNIPYQEPTEKDKILNYISGAVGFPFTVFLASLVLMLVNWFVRGEATYMQLVKVFLYSRLPTVLGQLLTGVLVRVTGTDDFREVSINGSVLVGENAGILRRLAGLIDPFAIWGLVVLVIGMSVAAKRPSARVAVWLVVLWVLVSVSLSGMAFM